MCQCYCAAVVPWQMKALIITDPQMRVHCFRLLPLRLTHCRCNLTSCDTWSIAPKMDEAFPETEGAAQQLPAAADGEARQPSTAPREG